MNEPRLDEWLEAVGFDAGDSSFDLLDADDPWGSSDVAITPLSDEQRAFLSAVVVFGDDPVDPAGLAEADEQVIDFPDDPEPF